MQAQDFYKLGSERLGVGISSVRYYLTPLIAKGLVKKTYTKVGKARRLVLFVED